MLAPGGTITGTGTACRLRLYVRSLPIRIWRGRPVILALRLLLTAAVGAVAVTAVGWQPASIAIVAGLASWLLRAAASDVAPPPG